MNTYGSHDRKNVYNPALSRSIKWLTIERGESPVQRPIVGPGNRLVKYIAEHTLPVHNKAGALSEVSKDERRIDKTAERELFKNVRDMTAAQKYITNLNGQCVELTKAGGRGERGHVCIHKDNIKIGLWLNVLGKHSFTASHSQKYTGELVVLFCTYEPCIRDISLSRTKNINSTYT